MTKRAILRSSGDGILAFPVWVMFLLLWCVLLPLQSLAGQEKTYNVLVLHSYHKGLSWTDNIIQGIEDGFGESGLQVEMSHEFMDTKRNNSPEYLKKLAELYLLKYQNSHIDLIISSDDHAFQFLRTFRDKIFPNIPVVFCGVNDFKQEMLIFHPGFTGVVEAYDMVATLNIALRLHPKAENLVIVLDQTLSGKKNRSNFLKIRHLLDRKVNVKYLDHHSMAEVEHDVAGLGEKDIVVWFTFVQDRLGHFYTFQQSSRLISRASHAPLYSFWDFNLGHGIVGGRLTSGYSQGQSAVKLAVRILQGERPEEVPVITQSPNRYMFDYKELVRFGVSLLLLPPGAIVVNRPTTFLETHKTKFYSLIVTFGLLIVIITFLLFNIRQRRKSAGQLAQARNRFQKIFDEAAIALFEVDVVPARSELNNWRDTELEDVDGWLQDNAEKINQLAALVRVRACNPAAFSLFAAKSASDFFQDNGTAVELLSTDDFRYLVKSYLKGGQQQEWESTIRTLDGKTKYLLKRTQAGVDEDRVIVSGLDITSRKQSLEELQRSEDRFRTLFDSAASGVALASPEGFFLKANQAFSEMIGYSQAELEGRHWKDITHHDDHEMIAALHHDLFAGKSRRPVEIRYINRDGRVIWATLTLGGNRNRYGDPVNIVAQMQDITRRKQVEGRMRVRDARYRQIFEADLSGFYIANPSGKILLCNQAFSAMLGYSSVAEVVGRNLSAHYQHHGDWKKVVESLWEHQKIDNKEMVLLRTDGNTVHVLCNAIGRFSDHGQLEEIQGHLVNISQQKQLETRLVRAQKMEAIGLMASGVAHDLNNILSGIVSYPELMLITLAEDHPHYRSLQLIREAGQRAAAVVADLLTVARSAANARETQSMSQLVRQYLASPEYQQLQNLYPEITLEFDDAEEELWMSCSPIHVKKCLMNLVTNAMEAIEGKGVISIAIGVGTMHDGEKEIEAVILTVADSGPGISSVDLENIFEPFYTRKVMGKSGTGLGLAVVWNTVQEHDGRIRVESDERGTVFTLFFPGCGAVERKTEGSQVFTSFSGLGERILVVDDEPMLRDIASQILVELGYQVDVVESGEAALAFLREESVDLVLLDMFMEPGINGQETYRQILTINPQQKAIIASGFSKSDDVRAALQLGVGRFIEKPYTIEQLGRAVCEELST